MMDMTGDESQDWMDPGRTNTSARAAAADYAEGDKIETTDGERGIVEMHVEALKVSEDGDGPNGDTLVCEFDRTALSLKRENAE